MSIYVSQPYSNYYQVTKKITPTKHELILSGIKTAKQADEIAAALNNAFEAVNTADQLKLALAQPDPAGLDRQITDLRSLLTSKAFKDYLIVDHVTWEEGEMLIRLLVQYRNFQLARLLFDLPALLLPDSATYPTLANHQEKIQAAHQKLDRAIIFLAGYRSEWAFANRTNHWPFNRGWTQINIEE